MYFSQLLVCVPYGVVISITRAQQMDFGSPSADFNVTGYTTHIILGATYTQSVLVFYSSTAHFMMYKCNLFTTFNDHNTIDLYEYTIACDEAV